MVDTDIDAQQSLLRHDMIRIACNKDHDVKVRWS